MAGLVAEVSDSTFEADVVGSQQPYLVDFWAPWCGPCRIVAPIVDELAKEYDGRVKMGKVNIDDNETVAQSLGITSIPTIIIFKNGEMHDRIVGALPKAALKDRIEKALA